MLVFVTSVRHPLNSTSYEKVEKLLAGTLDSICNQTDQNFHVIVVCNQTPKFCNTYQKVDFLKVDFPPPSQEKNPKIDLMSCLRDKGTKRLVGVLHAKQYAPTHIMFFDADDRVSNKIAGYVNSHPQENGWLVTDGYTHGLGMSLLMQKKDFHLACGTSIIINYKLLEPYLNFPETPTQEMILQKTDSDFLYNILGNHRKVEAYFKESNRPLKPLPFPAAIWVVNTGENRSVDKGIAGLLGQSITKNISEEFTLEYQRVGLKALLNIAFKLPKAIQISLSLLLFRDLKNNLYRYLSKLFIVKLLKSKAKNMVN